MRPRAALSLLELMMVIGTLAALSGMLIPLFTSTIHDGHATATMASLKVVRDAVTQYWSDTKLVTLDGVTTVGTEANRLSLAWLFANPVNGDETFSFNPATRIGWRGPYLGEATGDLIAFGERTLIDAWNHELTIQDVNSAATLRDVRIVSAGPNGTIDIPLATPTSALTDSDIGDDVYVSIELR